MLQYDTVSHKFYFLDYSTMAMWTLELVGAALTPTPTTTGATATPTDTPTAPLATNTPTITPTPGKCFQPNEVPGLMLWLKADAITGITDGNLVATWPDSSGLGRDATQPVSDSQPLWYSALANGQPVVRFDGVNDFMATAGQSYAAKTLMVVFAKNTATFSDYNGIATTRTGTGNKTAASDETNGIAGRLSTNNITGFGTASGIYLDGSTPSLSAYNTSTTGIALGAGAITFHYVTHERSASTAGAKYWVIGADAFSTGRYLSGDIAEIIVYDHTLASDVRWSIEACLGQKYGFGPPPTLTVTPTVTNTPNTTPTVTPTQCGAGTTWHVGPTRLDARCPTDATHPTIPHICAAPCDVLGDGSTKPTLVHDCDTVEIDSLGPCKQDADCQVSPYTQYTSWCVDGVCAYRSSSLCEGAQWNKNRVTVKGVGGPVIVDANGRGSTGLWNVSGNNNTIDGITFQCAIYQQIPECHNVNTGNDPASGLNLLGHGLTVRNSVFRYNGDGILTANNVFDGTIDIQNSEFYRNGYGVGGGQTHNLYIGAIDTLIFRGNYSHSTARDAGGDSGHTFKSRAKNNYIEYNRIMDLTDGNSSFLINVPNGGLTYVIGNLLEKYSTQNTRLVRYADEGGGASGWNPIQELYVVNNTMVNDTGVSTTFAEAYGDATHTPTVLVRNNIAWGAGSLFVCYRGTCASTLDHNITAAPTFVNQAAYDYRLLAGSPAIGAAVAPGTARGYSLVPTLQYQYDLQTVTRAVATDAGALSYTVLARPTPPMLLP
ncbi:MAG: hypothetical protein ACHQ9S_17875 [Candidatus Binatia bacterium]